ncbi:hypothetical protein M3Y97_00593800 [Aphelenchoides bicaudatus]|nr:hypothetical protein M3Y97_00593800 [Aphelenchoides bicaudatus]
MPSEEGVESSSRRAALKPGEWACSDSKCATINQEKRQNCIDCGKSKPKPRNKSGVELGKDAAEKSKGLFSAEDWMCTKCGNVNWAKRKTCNICNSKKNADVEERSGFGGGYNDRQQVEYKERKDDDEFDEFGRKKKKKQNDLEQKQMEEEEEDSGSEGDLDKYNFDDFDDIKIDLSHLKKDAESKEETESVVSSDCSCSCSGGECSCEDEEPVPAKHPKRDEDRSSRNKRSPERNRHDDRHRDRSREKRRSRERSRDRGRHFGLGGDDSPFTSPTENSNYDKRNTEKDNLVDGSETETSGNQHSFLSFKFYQQYFDVDTEQVQTRIINSAFPKKGSNFIRDHVQPSPDLYGPLWISITLVFCASICGNFARYIDSLGETKFTSDFTYVTGISTIIACYVLLVPLALYILFYYRNTSIQYSYAELLTLYGYSLAIFIPVSVLWVLHFNWLRWTLIGVSIFLSGFVLGNTIFDAIKTDKNKVLVLGVVCGVVVLHAGLAIGMKEYYFDSVLPPKQADDIPKLPENLPLVSTAKTGTGEPPKASALLGPDPSKETNDQKAASKKAAQPVLEAKMEKVSDSAASQKPTTRVAAEQKPNAKTENKPTNKAAKESAEPKSKADS